MYKLRVWVGPGKDWWVYVSPDWEDWGTRDNIEHGSELTIEWIQRNLGSIFLYYQPEKVEILQVREHSK